MRLLLASDNISYKPYKTSITIFRCHHLQQTLENTALSRMCGPKEKELCQKYRICLEDKHLPSTIQSMTLLRRAGLACR
jgi:hypothetical protein